MRGCRFSSRRASTPTPLSASHPRGPLSMTRRYCSLYSSSSSSPLGPFTPLSTLATSSVNTSTPAASASVSNITLQTKVSHTTHNRTNHTQARNQNKEYFYDDTVEKWASRELQPVSLRGLADFGDAISHQRLLTSASFVLSQLPIRLAKELRNFELLPYLMMTNPNIKRLYALYGDAFRRLINFPRIKIPEQNSTFVELLKDLMSETVNVVEIIAQGVTESYRRVPAHALNIKAFLDHFLISRIGRRVLADQHIQMSLGKSTGTIGIVTPNCLPADTLREVAQIVSELCDRSYGIKPSIFVQGDIKATVPMIVDHLRYIFTELLKNACRATVEHWRSKTKKHFPDLPPVEVTIFDGIEQVVIRVSDKGGGIQPSIMDKVFEYGYTSVPDMKELRQGLAVLSTSSEDLHSPMAGLGFGLPLARLYARHFGGALEIHSIFGYGSEVYLRLDKKGEMLEKLTF